MTAQRINPKPKAEPVSQSTPPRRPNQDGSLLFVKKALRALPASIPPSDQSSPRKNKHEEGHPVLSRANRPVQVVEKVTRNVLQTVVEKPRHLEQRVAAGIRDVELAGTQDSLEEELGASWEDLPSLPDVDEETARERKARNLENLSRRIAARRAADVNLEESDPQRRSKLDQANREVQDDISPSQPYVIRPRTGRQAREFRKERAQQPVHAKYSEAPAIWKDLNRRGKLENYQDERYRSRRATQTRFNRKSTAADLSLDEKAENETKAETGPGSDEIMLMSPILHFSDLDALFGLTPSEPMPARLDNSGTAAVDCPKQVSAGDMVPESSSTGTNPLDTPPDAPDGIAGNQTIPPLDDLRAHSDAPLVTSQIAPPPDSTVCSGTDVTESRSVTPPPLAGRVITTDCSSPKEAHHADLVKHTVSSPPRQAVASSPSAFSSASGGYTLLASGDMATSGGDAIAAGPFEYACFTLAHRRDVKHRERRIALKVIAKAMAVVNKPSPSKEIARAPQR